MEDRDEFAPSPEQMPPSFAPTRGRVSHRMSSEEEVSAATENTLDETSEASQDKSADESSSWVRSALELVAVVVAALLISIFIKTFFVQAFYVPSGSMETTLLEGDRIAVNRMARGVDDIHRGDVIVFVDPGGWLDPTPPEKNRFKAIATDVFEAIGLLPQNSGQHLVKRVIGVGGDTVSCAGNGAPIMVNGVAIDETYLDPGVAPSVAPFSVTVPAGHLWVMGDNRGDSKDSRFHQASTGDGFVPIDNVVGRVWAIFYPFSRFGSLEGGNAPFADVPSGNAK